MASELYLIASDTLDAAEFAPMLHSALEARPVAALLLPRGGRSAADYAALAEALLPQAQQHGCAVLLDNDPELARRLGADGVHISAGVPAVLDALTRLKPDFIVGAGPFTTRHEAMSAGEAGADYVMFGDPLQGASEHEEAEAQWWAETFVVPGVLVRATTAADLPACPCEFLGLGTAVWSDPAGPAAAIERLASRLESAA